MTIMNLASPDLVSMQAAVRDRKPVGTARGVGISIVVSRNQGTGIDMKISRAVDTETWPEIFTS
jgi:hypothetical protein